MNWGFVMGEKPLDKKELDDVFAAARANNPQVREDLLLWIVEEAEAPAEPEALPIPIPRKPETRPPLKAPPVFAPVLVQLGGWRALAGLGAASLLGIWIGTNVPETLDVLSLEASVAAQAYDAAEAFAPSYSELLSEG